MAQNYFPRKYSITSDSGIKFSILSVLFFSVLFHFNCHAEETTESQLAFNLINNGAGGKYAEICSSEIPYSGDVIIPDSVQVAGEMYAVESIGVCAFQNCTDLESVTATGNCLRVVKDNAFALCDKLKEVSLGDSIRQLGNRAFYRCELLTNVNHVDSVNYIGHYAFSECASLSSISLPGLIESGDFLFYNCKTLKDVAIGEKISKLSRAMFKNCISLQDFNIPVSATTIGEDCFSGCSALKSVEMHPDIIEIQSGAFSFCNEFRFDELPVKLKKIGAYSFEGTKIDVLELPDNLLTIDKGAFRNCRNLKSILFNDRLTLIPERCFESCISIDSLQVEGSINEIGENAFADCTSLSLLRIRPDVKIIGSKAFDNCSGLKRIYTYCQIPPVISYSTFDKNTFENAKLYVWKDDETRYRQTPYWQNFLIIGTHEEDTFADSVGSDRSYNLDIIGNILRINSGEATVAVYSVTGEMVVSVPSFSERQISIPGGIYIVTDGVTITKIKTPSHKI